MKWYASIYFQFVYPDDIGIHIPNIRMIHDSGGKARSNTYQLMVFMLCLLQFTVTVMPNITLLFLGELYKC